MPSAPFAVFKTNFEPESSESGVAEAVVEPESFESGAAEAVVESAADSSLEELSHAAANVANAARERPTPSVRSEFLWSMSILNVFRDAD
ncbi:hypothetical protein ACH4D3_32645 [Streptomyces sp. NPDC018026]|uniref:hypothetical protein n=1 Tax=Streptomyces sp. NPDC018026 TaxID=3365031 RepID=UPI0037A986BF